MAAIGYFPLHSTSLINPNTRVIYKAPATSPTAAPAPAFPTSRLPATQPIAPTAPPPRGIPRIPAPTTAPDTAAPINVPPAILIDGGATGGTTTSGGGSSTGTSPGTTTGAGTGGGGGGGDTSRLLDLLSGAFQTQPITQGYAPQTVSSDAIAPSGGGSNPGALLFLGILALVGVVWYMNRKKRAA